MQHVVTRIGGDDGSIWSGVPADRAVAWTEAFLRLPPVWPGAGAMWAVSQGVRRGVPAGIHPWAHRARRAEAIGLTPDGYRRLFASLDRVPLGESGAHPDHDLDRSIPNHPVRRFDDALWAHWAGLVGLGTSDDDATRLLLADRDRATGAAR